MSEKNGGPAFPIWQEGMNLGDTAGPGMTLRDYFAARAMPEAIRYHLEVRGTQITPKAFDWSLVADSAYRMADAMLAERAK